MEKITWTCRACGCEDRCTLELNVGTIKPKLCPFSSTQKPRWGEVIERDEIMNILKSCLDAEMRDFADRFNMKHGDVSPTWQVQYDDLVMQLANLMGTWIEDNSDVGVKI